MGGKIFIIFPPPLHLTCICAIVIVYEVWVVLTQREDHEFRLLTILSGSEQPVGSVMLSLLLEEQHHPISSATIGRLLSEFDHRGYTIKHGYRGRTLTSAGETRLAELTNLRDLSEFSDKFHRSVDVGSQRNLIDILTARRGIEREMVRLAAINATEEDLRNIRETFELQTQDAEGDKLSAEYDIAFHRAIAAASKNPVLAAAFDFIWQNGKFSPVIEYIRTYVGGVLTVDHKSILTALEKHDSAEAERRMVHHIESLINDVDRYWSLAENGKSE